MVKNDIKWRKCIKVIPEYDDLMVKSTVSYTLQISKSLCKS